MSLTQLQEQRGTLMTQARERLDEINDNTDEARTAELEDQHDKAMADLDALDKKIEREACLAEAERRSTEIEERMNAGDLRRPNGNGESRAVDANEEETSYDDAFNIMVRHGVTELNNEQRSLLMSGHQSIDAENRAQGVGTGAAGGFTVPQGFVSELDKALAVWGPMYDGNIIREMPTDSGNDLPYPTVDDTTNEGEDRQENAKAGDSNIEFGEERLKAFFRDTGIVKVSFELLQDSAFDMQSLLNDLFGERLGRRANRELTTGSGSNQAQGIVTGSALGVDAASAAALAPDELIDLVHKVDPAYRQSPKCRWQFNDETLATIRKLKDGQDNYLWQMGDVRSKEPNTLLGHAYSVNQAMAGVAGGEKPIIFGDHSRYVVRKVKGFDLMTLRERYAEFFQVGFVGYKRYDGRLIRPAAVKHLKMAPAS